MVLLLGLMLDWVQVIVMWLVQVLVGFIVVGMFCLFLVSFGVVGVGDGELIMEVFDCVDVQLFVVKCECYVGVFVVV